MDRKRRTSNKILIMKRLHILSIIVICLTSCNGQKALTEPGAEYVTIRASAVAAETRSQDPDEDLISNLNWFIFRKDGRMEQCGYVGKVSPTEGSVGFRARLLHNVEYNIFVCANIGYQIRDVGSIDELMSKRFYLAYPDEYSKGMPMTGKALDISIEDDNTVIDIPLSRMMSKISVNVDRNKLSSGVKFTVHSISIGNCPKSAMLFADSKAEADSDIFAAGFLKSGAQADSLNINVKAGISGSVSVYMLENMQGDILKENTQQENKVLTDLPALEKVCSYIEIKAEYQSQDWHTPSGKYLIYRFYLGESSKNFDIVRNSHYHFTICPENDGLPEDGWRVDKSGLSKYQMTGSLRIRPGNYIEGNVGSDIHIRIEVDPEDLPFSIGSEELEYDKERGLYDYDIDDDGKGVVLHLLKKGSGLLYFEAGYPVCCSEMAVIVIN